MFLDSQEEKVSLHYQKCDITLQFTSAVFRRQQQNMLIDPMPSVSVIIVNYNSGPLLAKAVARVARSTVSVEILVSDNGSSDDSLTLVQSTADDVPLRIFANNANLGFAGGNNLVLPYATGDYLLFLNPDCLIEADTLERMLAVLEQRPDVGMAGCLILNTDGSEQSGCRRHIPTPWQALMRVMHLSKLFPAYPPFQDFNLTGSALPAQPVDMEAISGAFMLVRREALTKVGPLDAGYFLHCEDLDWCMRFRQAGYRILFVPEVVITHVQGVCSVSRPVFVEWHKHKGMVRFYHKFFRQRYPLPLLWLVYMAVWSRFVAKAILLNLRHKRPIRA